MALKRLKGSRLASIVSGLVLGASTLLSTPAYATADALDIGNKLDTKTGILINGHYTGATETGADGLDAPYSNPPFPPENWDSKITTYPYSELELDVRPENSETSYNANLSLRNLNPALSLTNSWSFAFEVGGDFNGADTNRHYWVEINIPTNYTANGQGFNCVTNVRDVIANGGWVTGPVTTNLTNNAQYGTLNLHCPFNRIVSDSTSGGTNTPNGNFVMPYNANTNVILNANPNNHIDYYVLTRTDNTGAVSVVTNTLGQGFTSTNIPINNIKGSNNIYAVYDINKYLVTVNSTNNLGQPVGTPVPGTTNYSHGTTATQSIESVVADTNNPTEKQYRNIGYTLSP